jgi:hypothetical protein
MEFATRLVRYGTLILLPLGGCAARVETPEHWLEPCQQDGDCATLRCLTGVCTITCRTDAECALSGEHSAYCVDACTDGACGYAAVCSAPCGNGRCPPSGGIAASSHSATFQQESVPQCPMPDTTVSRPVIVMQTSEGDYVGPATVTGVAINHAAFPDAVASLEFTDRAGASLAVHFMQGTIDGILSIGRRVSATLRTGGIENLKYNLLVLRDEGNPLLLAYYSGSDQLYQSGVFDTPDVTGFTLELNPLCRSAVDGCFEHQSQAEYMGTFATDDRLSLRSGQEGSLTLAKRPYSVRFWSQSVDGGKSLCKDVPFPGRYVEFYLY